MRVMVGSWDANVQSKRNTTRGPSVLKIISSPARSPKLACASCSLNLRPLQCHEPLQKLASGAMLRVLSTYRKYLSPMMLPNCRFVPSCSFFMIEAIEKFGPWKGFLISAWRLIRCNPTGGSGYDPPTWPLVPYNAGI